MVSKSQCPVEGCTVTAGSEYLRTLHQHLEHCRCACGWIGTSKSIGHHAGQVARRYRDAGTVDPCPLHVITSRLAPLLRRQSWPDPPPLLHEKPEIIL